MIKDLLGRLFYLIPRKPKNVQISVTNVCNFDCAMCQRFDLKVNLKHLPFDLYKQILVKIDGAENIILTGWGEPLTHPDIIEMIKLAKEKGMNVRFTTNGSLLNADMATKLLAAGIDSVTFSIDAIKKHDNFLGHPDHNQLQNIIEFKKLIDSEKSNTKIYLQSVYQKNGENDLLDIVDYAIENKLDRIRLSRLDTRFHDFDRPTWDEEKALIRRIESKLKNTSVGLDFLPHTAFDGLAKIAYQLVAPYLHRFGKYCLRTYDDVYINEDGLVTPCCALPNLLMGDITKTDLADIWQSENFQSFRQNQKAICGKCDVLAIKTYNK